MNQQQARTDDNMIKREALENIELCDQFKDKSLDDLWQKNIDAIQSIKVEVQERFETKMNDRFTSEIVILKKWTEDLLRTRINEEVRLLQRQIQFEIRKIRRIFEVPGVIGPVLTDDFEFFSFQGDS